MDGGSQVGDQASGILMHNIKKSNRSKPKSYIIEGKLKGENKAENDGRDGKEKLNVWFFTVYMSGSMCKYSLHLFITLRSAFPNQDVERLCLRTPLVSG